MGEVEEMAERMGDRDALAQLQEPPEGGPVTGKFGVLLVDGPSMAPTLSHGDRLLCHYGARVQAGSVVVAQHPLRQDLLVVKRAVERRATGWWLLSDNSAVESDSRDYGPVPDDLILGRVLLRFAPNPAWLAPPSWCHPALRAMPYGMARRFGDFRRA